VNSSPTGNDSGVRRLVLIAIPVVLILAVVGLAAVFPSASNQGYQPDQPIPFSHKLHAGANKIACTYCHVGVERSSHATIPALNVCMNCHRVVKTDSPWIQQIKKHYDEGTPIEWVRIHELPDFVHFPHVRHVTKGIACQTCHGPIQEMDKVYQYGALTMGWCLDCHRGVTTPQHILQAAYPGEKDPRGKQVAPTTCATCHY
jgi:hypothetical protein